MQALPHLCHRRVHTRCAEWRYWRRRIFLKGRESVGRGYQVCLRSTIFLYHSLLSQLSRYLVYKLRKRGGDSAEKCFKSTEMIAGVKDKSFQTLMPYVLHWLGIKKVDKTVSMSDMKYGAIVKSGIGIWKRYDIPGEYYIFGCL